MLKRFISIILVISFMFGISVQGFADSNNVVSVKLNDSDVLLEQEVYFNENGIVMCPLREIAEGLGYKVTWNDEDRSVSISKEENTVKISIGESNVIANDTEDNMSTSVVLKNSKTYVPVEFFSNALDLIVGWDSKSNSLNIREAKINTEDYFKSSEDQTISDNLNEYMEALVKNRNFHGSVLVAKDGEILLNSGYGYANFHQNTRNKSQTRYAIGSVTKSFVSMGIMQLYEEGLIDVEDKVSKYLPNFPNGDSITIYNLLTHTSGLVNFTDLPQFYSLALQNSDPMTVVDLIKDLPLQFEPGEKFSYCNSNYLLLGIILENVSGMTYEEYLKKNIFEPLNMNDTGILFGNEDVIYDATAYDGYLEVIPVDDEILLRNIYGAGNIYSTVEDLYRWDRGLKTEKLVKEETLNEIFTKYEEFPNAGYYGYGWVITDTGLGQMIWHDGATLGFSANVARFVDDDLTIIILTNNRLYNTLDLINNLIAVVYNLDYEMPEPIEEMEVEDLSIFDKYVGEYVMNANVIITITRDDNGIYAQFTGQNQYQIFPKSENEFFYKITDAQITFIENEEGEVTGLVLHQLDMDFNAEKIK